MAEEGGSKRRLGGRRGTGAASSRSGVGGECEEGMGGGARLNSRGGGGRSDRWHVGVRGRWPCGWQGWEGEFHVPSDRVGGERWGRGCVGVSWRLKKYSVSRLRAQHRETLDKMCRAAWDLFLERQSFSRFSLA